MLERIELHNFKSARNLPVRLAALTVLTGLNGSGKSSVLQALALLKQSLRIEGGPQELVLRGTLVHLGRSEDVRFENASDDEIGFIIQTPQGQTKLTASAEPGADTLRLSHDGDIKDLDDAFKKEIEKAVDQDAQTSEYLSVTCFEDGWPSSVLKQNKNVMAGRGKLKQKLIEACRFAQREK